MRERKFRVWDNFTKKMYYEVELIKKEDGWWFMWKAGCLQNNWEIDNKQRIVMDFANVVDKTNEMIFEGDILEEDNGNIFTVEWYKTGLQMRALETEEVFFTLLESCELKILKIIGNIYENPELISK